jgi:hypothetical protein
MAKAISSADSASRPDPILPMTMPARPQRCGIITCARMRTTS